MSSILDTTNLTAIKSLLGITTTVPSDLEIISFINQVSNTLTQFGLSPFLTGEQTLTESSQIPEFIQVAFPINSITSITQTIDGATTPVDLSKIKLIKYGKFVYFCESDSSSCCNTTYPPKTLCNVNYEITYKTGYQANWDVYLNQIVKILYNNFGVDELISVAKCDPTVSSIREDDTSITYFNPTEIANLNAQKQIKIYELIAPFLSALLPKYNLVGSILA